MGLLTAADIRTLQNWGLEQDYENSRAELIEVARIGFAITRDQRGNSPSPEEFLGRLVRGLMISAAFSRILRSKRHAPPALHIAFASLTAKLLIDHDWGQIAIS